MHRPIYAEVFTKEVNQGDAVKVIHLMVNPFSGKKRGEKIAKQAKQMFEQTARMPTVNPHHQHPPAPAQAPPPQPQAPPPQPVQPVTPEQAAQEIAAAQAPPMPDQEEFDFSEPAKIDKLIDLIEKQTLILEKISLKLDNGKSAKNRKQR